MKNIILISTFLITIFCNAQNVFQTGYFITNDGSKTECLIKNMGWKNNPESFDYKIGDDSEVTTVTIANVKEFSVNNAYTFKRFDVKIDLSSNLPDLMNSNKEPEWQYKTLFLKVLVAGDVTLYEYENSDSPKYFVSTAPHDSAGQLFYKEYRIGSNIYKNNAFRGQLYEIMKDKFNQIDKFKNISYRKNALVKLFMEYGGEHDEQVTDMSQMQNKGNVNIKITGAVNFTSAEISRRDYGYNFTMDGKTTFAIGAEIEYMLPFNNNKWSLLINPSYSSYKNSGEDKFYEWQINCNFIEIPVAARYHMYLSEKSKLFINAGCTFAPGILKNTVSYSYVNPPYSAISNSFPFDATLGYNFMGGAGFSFDKYSVEIRYNSQRSLLPNSDYVKAKYGSINAVFAYKIL